MGDYNFQGLNTRDFEHLVQSLTKKILGNGSITFGDGTDGGREATFNGLGYYHSLHEGWEGYWVIQAKFKQRESGSVENYQWIKNNFLSEMAKFEELKKKDKNNLIPDNYLFFTNVVLTPVLDKGMLDKINELITQFKWLIPNISVVGYDDLCRLLDNNRDVATSYSSFIRTGDILEQVFNFFQEKNNDKKNYSQALLSFLYKEFTADLPSQLRQAGDNTGEKVNLEDVFIDLFATKNSDNNGDRRNPKFLERCIQKGNTILRPLEDHNNNSMGYALIGDAGYGKSTLTQFLCQTYRAYFLFNNSSSNVWPQVEQFKSQFVGLNITQPVSNRYPFKIILKDYAGWAVENKKKQKSFSVISYFQHRLKVVADIEISKEEIRDLLKSLSFIFIFDGLDEVPASSNRSDIVQEVNQFVEVDVINNNCDALIVATTRPQGYNDEFNKVNLEKLQLVPLSIDECKKYIVKIVGKFSDDPDQVSRLTKILFKALEDDTVSKLMETPLQATIMAFLVRMGGEPPRNKFDLFSNYVNTMITREQQKGVVEVINDLTHHIKTIHNKLGYLLHKGSEQENNPSSNISDEEFQSFIVNYLLDEVGYDTYQVNEIASNIMEAIEGRLAFITKTTDTSVGFCVRSLQEYFAAMFIMTHQSDAEVKNSLRKISSSAYWRKPFLFAVGYMTRQRADMIGYLIELCLEMNGEDIEFGEENAKSIAVLGSWLALDIINDGTLNTFPKYENMISRLLEQLFKITPQYSHRYFRTLPQGVIQKTVIPLIEKHIISNDPNVKLTTITNLFYVISNKNIYNEKLIELVELNWPNEDEEVFIEILLKHGFNNDWFINKIFDSIKSTNNRYLLHNKHISAVIYPQLISISSKDLEARWILFKHVFIGMLTVRSQRIDYIGLVKQFFQEDGNDSPSIETIDSQYNYFKDRISHGIYDGYEAVGESVFKSNKEVFSLILNNCYKINDNDNFISAYCQFVIEPNNMNLISFFEQLVNEEELVFNKLKESSVGLNWVMNNILISCKEKENILPLIEDLKRGVYGDTEEWEEFERALKGKDEVTIHALPKLNWRYMLDDEMLFLNIYRELYENNQFNSTEEKTIIEKEILKLFSFIELNTMLSEKLSKELLDELYSILERHTNIPNLHFLNILSRLIILMSPQQLLKLILNENQHDIKITNTLHLEDSNLILGFKKLCDILLPLKTESNLIRVLPTMLFSIAQNDLFKFKQIDFKYLREVTYSDNINETCRILLCVYDYILNDNNPQIVEMIKSRYLEDALILTYIIKLFESSKEHLVSIEPIFYSIYKQIDRNDLKNHELIRRYESFLKDSFEMAVTN